MPRVLARVYLGRAGQRNRSLWFSGEGPVPQAKSTACDASELAADIRAASVVASVVRANVLCKTTGH